MAYRLSTALRNAMLEQEAVTGELSLHVNTITLGDGDGADGADTINDTGAALANHKPGDKITLKGTSGGINDVTVEILTAVSNKVEVPSTALPVKSGSSI